MYTNESNFIGYLTMPVCVSGPLNVNNKSYRIPMTTYTSGVVENTDRGSIALNRSGGVSCYVISDGIYRLYVARFRSAERAVAAMKWLNDGTNYTELRQIFNRFSSAIQLSKILPKVASRYLFIKFVVSISDDSQTDTIAVCIQEVLDRFEQYFTDIESIFIGNDFCTNGNISALNCTDGREFYVVCEARVQGDIVKEVLKTSVKKIVDSYNKKTLFVAAVEGKLGGFNSQISRVVSGIYLSIGQEHSKALNSSKYTLILEECSDADDMLHITCTMPSIEIGQINLDKLNSQQKNCLQILNINDNNLPDLAQIICATVMASEFSNLAALSNE